jgi:hypothetical protein
VSGLDTTTSSAPSVSLRLRAGTDPIIEGRLAHALAVVADVLGLRVVDGPADLTVGWGTTADLQLPAGLQLRDRRVPAPAPVWIDRGNGRRLPAFHPASDGALDHLAEVFEWTSGLHELAVLDRDAVGRIASRDTLPIRAGLDPTVAWASRIIDDFAERILAVRPEFEAVIARTGEPVVALSHDLDFYGRGSADAVRRVARAILAAARRRDAATVRRILAIVAREPHRVGRRLATVEPLVDLDAAHGVEATWVVIPRREHRRDANYELDDIVDVVAWLDDVADVAVHGSYTSLDGTTRLGDEYAAMRAAGVPVTGGRQHWLRFAGLELFAALEAAGATWDSSVAYSDRVGFRHGMASPYRMWDPVEERTIPVLQIPLVMMDMSLDSLQRSGADWRRPAEAVLRELGQVRGGGASILWHDTVFSGLQTDPGIVDFYRDVLAQPFTWRSLSAVAAGWNPSGVGQAAARR